METEKTIVLNPIINYDIENGSHIPDIDRLKVISDEDYENCIAEWITEYLKDKYVNVKRYGGSGDKGRDVVAFINIEGDNDIYQCKYYSSPLMPSNIWVELGKILYYTYNGDYPIPRYYYLVAPKGLGRKLNDYMDNKEILKEELIKNWDQYCKSSITKTKKIELSPELKNYITNFDFTKIKELLPFEFLEQFKQTRYYVARFGGGLKKFRPPVNNPPLVIGKSELIYVKQLLLAYSDFKSEKISTEEDLKLKYPILFDHFKRQRIRFHSAQALQRFVRDSLPDDSFFIQLKDDLYSGLIDLVNEEYESGYHCIKKVLIEAGRIQLSNIITTNTKFKFSIDDRGGICHQLVNESKFKWVKNDI